MGAKVAFDEYKRNKVITANGVELIIQLYDEIMSNIRVARPILAKSDKLSFDEVKAKSKALSKAVNVVTALADSLDMEKGGEISNNLSKLYEFINMRLLNANLNNDPLMLDEAVRVLKELREAWVGIVKQEDHDKQKRTVERQKNFENGSAVIPGSKEKAMGVYNHIGLKT